MDFLLSLRLDFLSFSSARFSLVLASSSPFLFPLLGVLFSSPFLQLFSPRRPLLLSLSASPSLPALWGSPPVPPPLRALCPPLPTPSGPSLPSPSDLPRPLLLWAQLHGSLQRGPQAKGAQDWGRMPPFLCAPESRLEAGHSPRQCCLFRLPHPPSPLCLGPRGRGLAGLCPDAAGRLTFHVPGDGAEVHAGRGSQRLHRLGGPRGRMRGAFCGLCCNQRGDAERAGPGRQRAPRVHRRPAAWPAPPPTACTRPHGGQPSPRPGGGSPRCHSLPRPRAQGTWRHGPPPRAKGALVGGEPRGWCGPSCISSSPGLRLSSQGPLWPAPRDLLRLPKAWPPSVQRSHQLPPPRGEAAAGAPSPRPRRGAPAGPCPVLLPPPQLPLNLGVERTVQAPAAATGGRPQGCRVVLFSVPRDRTWPRERLPGPCGRLTVAPGDPELRDTAQAA